MAKKIGRKMAKKRGRKNVLGENQAKILIALPIEQHINLKEYAKRNNVTIASLVRSLIENHLNNFAQ